MMTVETDKTVNGMTFGSGWTFMYEDPVHRRRLIAADQVEYDLQMVSCCFGRLHTCMYSGAYSGVVLDVVFSAMRDAFYSRCVQ